MCPGINWFFVEFSDYRRYVEERLLPFIPPSLSLAIGSSNGFADSVLLFISSRHDRSPATKKSLLPVPFPVYIRVLRLNSIRNILLEVLWLSSYLIEYLYRMIKLVANYVYIWLKENFSAPGIGKGFAKYPTSRSAISLNWKNPFSSHLFSLIFIPR